MQTRSDKYMRKALYVLSLIITLSFLSEGARAQQYALYNSRTLYDSFENPSQQAFQADSSRKFAFNFFIPTFSNNSWMAGEAVKSLRPSIFDGSEFTANYELGTRKYNVLQSNTNIYLLMFRVFRQVKDYQEFGISWQARNDIRAKVSNTAIALYDPEKEMQMTDLESLNEKAHESSYHQFSFSYRQNFTKRFAAGAKISYLSGIVYHDANINSLSFRSNTLTGMVDVTVDARYRASYFENDEEDEDFSLLKPGFKNPGASISFGASYKFKHGWFLMGNVKDVGFIYWRDAANANEIKTTFEIDPNRNYGEQIGDELEDEFQEGSTRQNYTTLTNGKAQVLLGKDLNNYRPNLLLSKNLFNDGLDAVLINNYHYRNWIGTANLGYHTRGVVSLGGQVMYKTPNFEIFGGSDQVLASYQTAKGFIKSSEESGGNHLGASFYFGFGLKFGRDMEHQPNSNNIPGFDGRKTTNNIWRRIFGNKT